MNKDENTKVLLTFTKEQWRKIGRHAEGGGETNASLVYALIADYFKRQDIEYPDDLPAAFGGRKASIRGMK